VLCEKAVVQDVKSPPEWRVKVRIKVGEERRITKRVRKSDGYVSCSISTDSKVFNNVVHHAMKHLFPTLFRLLLDKIYALLVLAVTIVADVVRHAVTITGRPHRLIEES
jgi:hypothetical protein